MDDTPLLFSAQARQRQSIITVTVAVAVAVFLLLLLRRRRRPVGFPGTRTLGKHSAGVGSKRRFKPQRSEDCHDPFLVRQGRRISAHAHQAAFVQAHPRRELKEKNNQHAAALLHGCGVGVRDAEERSHASVAQNLLAITAIPYLDNTVVVVHVVVQRVAAGAQQILPASTTEARLWQGVRVDVHV